MDDDPGYTVAELSAGGYAAVAPVAAPVLVASYPLVAWSVPSAKAYVGEGYGTAVRIAVAPEVACSAEAETGVE